MEETKMNLFQKMLKITEELGKVGKNLEVKGADGKVRYNAVGETDVLDKVKPLEEKYGVYSYPLNRTCVELPNSNKVALRVETIYRFVNVDKPDEFIDITSYGDGIDSGDKAPGKAMTYSDKYALMKAYKISTGDDPDQDLSPEPMISQKQVNYLKDLLRDHPDIHVKMLGVYNVSKIENLTSAQSSEAIDRVKKNIEKKLQMLAKAQPIPMNEHPVSKPAEVKPTEEVKPAKTEVQIVKANEVETSEAKVEEPNKVETKVEEVVEKVAKATAVQKAKIMALMNEERRAKMLKAYKVKALDELSEKQAQTVIDRINRENKK